MTIQFKKQKIKFYLAVGATYLVFSLFGEMASNPKAFPPAFYNILWRSVFITAAGYFFFEYVRPLLSLKRVVASLLRIILTVFMLSVALYLWRGIGIALRIHQRLDESQSAQSTFGDQVSNIISAIIFFGIVKHIYDYRKLKQTTQLLRLEKQQAELNYLKSQTNPHFLFNTLNNIYALAREKSDKAPESILRLSKILRFMLYETSGAYICVEQELKIMSDYIELERLRYDESLRVNFNHDIEDMKQAIPPLLLIPLVENAFKHGVSETRGRPFVEIHLSIKQRKLIFEVRNSTDRTQADDMVRDNIGLSNLRRQLQLLYTDHSLRTEHTQSIFTATLIINLASHV